VRSGLVVVLVVVGAGLLLVFADGRPLPPVSSGATEPIAGPMQITPVPRAPEESRAPADSVPFLDGAAPETRAVAAAQPKDLSDQRRALEPLRREVFAGLGEQHWRVARCGAADATIYVTLESLDGAVRIVDTRVERMPEAEHGSDLEAGTMDPAVEDCVRSALMRNVVGAPSARPGRRWEMRFVPGPLD
jgi:hypothetical protein